METPPRPGDGGQESPLPPPSLSPQSQPPAAPPPPPPAGSGAPPPPPHGAPTAPYGGQPAGTQPGLGGSGAEPSTLYGAPPPPPPPAPPYAGSYGYGGPPATPDGPAPGLRYAGFGIRTGAYIVDAILILIVVAILSPALGGFTQQTTTNLGTQTLTTTTINSAVELFQILLGAVYFIGFWTVTSRTPGMMLTHLKVLRASDGRPIGLGAAVVRYIGLLISFFVVLLGVIWVAIDPRRQGWHDKMAGTFVVQEVGQS